MKPMQRPAPIDDLRKNRLPPMVRWYDPRLLFNVGVRTTVSSVFGQYADQRLIQAATDQATPKDLLARYDFRDPTPDDPLQRVALDDTGAFWVDYLADTGDGFDPTYTMAYLLAIDELKVPGLDKPLPAPDTLIMGGDQCYPQATREGYKQRLIDPFSWAFNVAKPQRKLFAIPGNHDWYDGLNAFDSLFCSSRDKLSDARGGNKIGGWQCQQHRSYWSMRLPYNWWIWGPDIQFSKYLDQAQINYFELVAQQMGKDDNVIICISEPDWLLADIQGEEDQEENFVKITTIARKNGARVAAVFAGDWHHYNRYTASDIGVHFITAGGGGAFLHPTHILRENISVRWPDEQPLEGADVAVSGASDLPKWRVRDVDIRLRKGKGETKPEEVVREVREAAAPVFEPLDEALHGKKAVKATRLIKQEAPVCYPSKGLSRLLSFRNLLFPIYNFPFALMIGAIYWLITWQFYSVIEREKTIAAKIDGLGVTTGFFEVFRWFPLYLIEAMLVSIPLSAMVGALLLGLIWYVDAVERPRWRRWLSKLFVGGAHFAAHITTMFFVAFLSVMINNWTAPLLLHEVDRVWHRSQNSVTPTGRVVKEALEPLSSQRAAQRAAPQAVTPQAPALPAPLSGGASNSIDSGYFRRILGFIMYPFQSIVLGGLIGGFVFGLYWVITSVLMRMHAAEAFAALRIKDYKNFLRLRFDRDTLTIYPIGVDKVPRRGFWRGATAESQPLTHAPRLRASGHIDVRLIEKPIVIQAKG